MEEFIKKLTEDLGLTSHDQKQIARMLVRQRLGSLIMHGLDVRLKEVRKK